MMPPILQQLQKPAEGRSGGGGGSRENISSCYKSGNYFN